MENIQYKVVDEEGKLNDTSIACCIIMDEKVGPLFRKLLKVNSKREIAKFIAAYCAGVCEMEGIEVPD